MQARSIDFQCAAPPDLQVYIDPDQAQQVLLNLCLNALQASSEGQVVRLDAEPWQGRVRMVVTDQGCGISAADLQNIRQPFFTLKARGTGLGLSICQQLLEANGARMEIASTVGEGTRVILDCPMPPSPLLAGHVPTENELK